MRRIIDPLLDEGVDEIALGCTHYPFLAPVIESIARGKAALLDPSEAVARQTMRVVQELGLRAADSPTQTFFTSGETKEFERVLKKLLGTENVTVFHADPKV